ncbi:MAG: hypothetical protein LWX56_11870, partial [Ignavibacteria bacterium]|nr:hypothetical protein [Ignavibacteria bacterium]
NNGVSWSTVIASTPSNGIYSWTVPNTISTNCKVRISDAADGNPSDISASSFTIAPQPILTLTQPNGNERILAGSTFEIRWTSSSKNNKDFSNVKIELTTDAGSSWSTLAPSAANTGLYQWNPVPSVSSTQCKIRVSEATTGTPTDVSDTTFTIYTQIPQTISLTTPNGGEVLDGGKSFSIKWTSTGVSSVNIDYSTNSGVSWNTVVHGTESNGLYLWNPIPNISSTNCKIRIYDPVDTLPIAISATPFTILQAPDIKVLSPNGGESLIAGDTKTIMWVSTNIANVKLQYTTNSGASWIAIADSVPSTGSYQWIVPAVNSALCKVRVLNLNNSYIPSDESDNVFSIATSLPQSITVTAPNGGESWASGTSQSITWTSSGIDSVKIEYSTDNGLHWLTLVAGMKSTGIYRWQSIPAVSSTNCLVRVSNVQGGTPKDESDHVFTISPEPQIKVLSPNGGDVWTTGSSQNIKWLSYNLPKVKIEYTSNNGASWNTIVDSTESTGSYLWTVPSLNSSLCKIRVSDPSDGLPSDESDSTFTISNQISQSLVVLSPNGGEKWEATTAQNITWSSSAINKVKIEYSTNNGLSWIVVVDSTESNGLYQWNPIPNISSTQCKIRISDASDGIPSDESNATFTVTPAKSIHVVYPNGGENLNSGTPYQIKWTSSGITSVKIDYRIDYLGEWKSIVVSTPSSGSYEWSPTVAASGYKIRITDAVDGNAVDESDASFTVLPEPSIQVVAPNDSNLVLQAGNHFDIRWTSTNLQNVMIDYSTNNGSSWTNIVASTESDGIYTWTVPNVNSSLCKIRISDITGLHSDVSDYCFSINSTGKQLRVTFPNLSTQNVSTDTVFTWYSFGVSNVNIDLSLDNGLTYSNLASNVQSTGAYLYHFNISQLSSLARLKVTDATDATVFDVSDAPFRIGVAKKIISSQKLSQNRESAKYKITWQGSQADALQVSFDDGKNWSTIQTNQEQVKNGSNQIVETIWESKAKSVPIFRVFGK